MAKFKPNPRYVVVSTRISDDMAEVLDRDCDEVQQTRGQYLFRLIKEKQGGKE